MVFCKSESESIKNSNQNSKKKNEKNPKPSLFELGNTKQKVQYNLLQNLL